MLKVGVIFQLTALKPRLYLMEKNVESKHSWNQYPEDLLKVFGKKLVALQLAVVIEKEYG